MTFQCLLSNFEFGLNLNYALLDGWCNGLDEARISRMVKGIVGTRLRINNLTKEKKAYRRPIQLEFPFWRDAYRNRENGRGAGLWALRGLT